MTKALFIWQLSAREKLSYYRKIKAYLIAKKNFTYERLVDAMSNKIVDLPYELQ